MYCLLGSLLVDGKVSVPHYEEYTHKHLALRSARKWLRMSNLDQSPYVTVETAEGDAIFEASIDSEGITIHNDK